LKDGERMQIEKAAEYAIRNVLKEGLTDIFDRPFEIELLRNEDFKKKVYDKIITAVKSGTLEGLGVNNIEHILIPKNSPFNFRRCALIHPMDTLKYLTLVLTIADEIEKARIPIKKKRIYSYRFRINKEYIFNTNYTITSFNKIVSEKVKRKKVELLISCDIANYYDRLNLHRLQNTLFSINCDRAKVKLINELLLFWSGRDSYGLPVGSNASRILAEANLIGVDNYLENMNVDFIRFVDDYRFFAPDSYTAHYWLTLLIDRLWQEGLTINMSKTKIESLKEGKLLLCKTKNKELEEKQDEKSKNIKKGNPFIIRAGYGGIVPVRFRELSKKEKENLNKINIQESVLELDKKILITVDKLVEAIKAIISQEKYDMLVEIITFLDKYLQITPYYIDVLIKYSKHLSNDEKNVILDYFTKKLMQEKYLPEYLILSYVKILGNEDFADRKLLMDYYRNLRKNSGIHVGRMLLESLTNLVNREDVLEIRRGFNRSDLWEKRQIIKMVDNVLDEEEKRPWLKNIRQVEVGELFLQETASINKKTKVVRKK